MRRALAEFTVEGITTNTDLAHEILYHPDFIRGRCTTAFMEDCLPSLLAFDQQILKTEEQS